jgi:hypothetical protein
VAFFGCVDPVSPTCGDVDADQGLFTGSGGPFTTIVDSSGPFRNFRGLAINNVGTVGFGANLDTGDSGIFTGPNPVADKVIGTGDSFFGSTITDIGRPSLNDSGQIAFFARLVDGTEGIYRADPDTDGDGIPDTEDECPDSDLSPTVVIDGCDSGVPNTLFPTGCTISDLIAKCADVTSCIAKLTNDLKRDGIITGAEKGAIQSCAAK